MTDKKKKSVIADRSLALHLLSLEKNNDSKNDVTSLSNSKSSTDGSSFFVPTKSRTSSVGPSRNQTYIDDRPSPEPLSSYYEKRKKIIFGKININQNEKEILKLILDSQNKANDLIKGKKGFFCSPKTIHGWVIALKENISNYCLVFYLYINKKQNRKASELFLLMNQQNKDLLYSIFREIKKNFKNMSNSNRIGKFYPTIIKIFFQILSVIIKLAAKFNKNLIENYYLKMYIQTIHDVKNTIITKFTSVNNDLENDFKLFGRFFYYECLYNVGIYFLYRYQPLSIIISLFQFIFEKYHEKEILYLINSEQILLLKINYNLGVLYYVEGNNIEALVNLNQAKKRLFEKIIFPFTKLKGNNQTINKASISTKLNTNNDSNNINQDRSSISSFNIDESVEKVLAGRSNKKRSISSRVSRDMMIREKNFEPTKKICSNIVFGKEKFIFQEVIKYINNTLSQKIEIEIELLMAEIELNQKNFKESFIHVNRILDTVRLPSRRYLKEKSQTKRIINTDNNSTLNNSNISLYIKNTDVNKNNSNNNLHNTFNIPKLKLCQTISDSNKRHISYILEQIEQEYIKRNEFPNSNNDIQNIEYDYKKLESNKFEYDKRLNENINRERKISMETEKFFIFICGLSIYQLKVLNEFQPEPSTKRDDLPILFPNQFKDCLTFSQRLALNNLDTMSLSRYIILKDTNKNISPENLDYVFLTRKIKSSYKNKLDLFYDSNKNNDYLNNILLKLSKKSTIRSVNSIDSFVGTDKNNLFNKETFQKFIEEDKIFNQKITEITHKDTKKYLEKNRFKILKIFHGLNPKEKEFLIKSSSFLNDFLVKIEKKMSKKKK